MPGSTFGKIFRIHTFGESHGEGLGAVIDGVPAGLELSEKDIQKYLDRRKPGQSSISTPRKEDDFASILSGIFEGKTTGTPIAVLVKNTSQRSSDYSQIMDIYRPGHADYTFDEKFGFRDYRGGGRSSGRETIGRVIGGSVAAKMLGTLGISIFAYTKSIGPVSIDYDNFDADEILKNPCVMPDAKAARAAEAFLKECMEEKDSAGGVIECVIQGLPAGIGEPVFDKLDALLAQSVMSVGGVKAVEIGDGTAVSILKGSQNNDGFRISDEGKVVKTSNHSGGTLGGISDGSDVILRAHIKPTPSIFRQQETVNRMRENVPVVIKGRHDPVIVPRAAVVVECMCALTVADLLLMNMSSRMEYLDMIYKV